MRVLITLALVFGLGGCLGNKMASPGVEFVTITKTKTVKEPAPPPAEISVVPQSCLNALRYAEKMALSAENIFDRGRQQLDIISDARIAMTTRVNMTPVIDRQRNLTGLATSDLSNLSDSHYRYQVALKECEKEQ